MLYDVAIIGGGVVGCSILHELTRQGYSCVLLEKNTHLASGASSGNSGMFHTGFDATPDTLEDQLIAEGQSLIKPTLNRLSIPYTESGAIMVALNQKQIARMDLEETDSLESTLCSESLQEMRTFLQKSDIPYRKLGSILVAISKSEKEQIQQIYRKAVAKGVTDVRLLSKSEVLTLEPNLTTSVLGGMLVPGEYVLDSCLYVVSLAHQAVREGAKIQKNSEMKSAKQLSDGTWSITTSSGNVISKTVINAAGLYGDNVDKLALGSASFRVNPMRGEFAVFSKEAGSLINHIILPVPNHKSKGVLIFPSAYGNLVIGPTAVVTSERENPSINAATVRKLVSYGRAIVPKLKEFQVFHTYAGIRPATQYKDYQIIPNINKNWLTVGGIRSTGVTGSLGIAHHVHSLLQNQFKLVPSRCPVPTTDAIAVPWVTTKPSYVLDGTEYEVTHQLMKTGLKTQSKL